MPHFLLLAQVMSVQASKLVDGCGILSCSNGEASCASYGGHCGHDGFSRFILTSLAVLEERCLLVRILGVSWWTLVEDARGRKEKARGRRDFHLHDLGAQRRDLHWPPKHRSKHFPISRALTVSNISLRYRIRLPSDLLTSLEHPCNPASCPGPLCHSFRPGQTQAQPVPPI